MHAQPDPWERFWLTGSIRDYLAARRQVPPPHPESPPDPSPSPSHLRE